MSPVIGTPSSPATVTTGRVLGQNYYATLQDVKDDLGIDDTSKDVALGLMIDGVSREMDDFCGRRFYVETATRYFSPSTMRDVVVDDLLSITTLTTDSELDGTYDGETWAASDYQLWPYNTWPKSRIEATAWGRYGFPINRLRYTNALPLNYPLDRYVKVVGQWGYGDGLRATPYDLTTALAASATASATTITLDATGLVKTGHTILVGSEQMFVEAVSEAGGVATLTVKRGVNGTTAAIIGTGGSPVSIYRYPSNLVRFVQLCVSEIYNTSGSQGLQMEQIGSYIYQKQALNYFPALRERMLTPFVRCAT